MVLMFRDAPLTGNDAAAAGSFPKGFREGRGPAGVLAPMTSSNATRRRLGRIGLVAPLLLGAGVIVNRCGGTSPASGAAVSTAKATPAKAATAKAAVIAT